MKIGILFKLTIPIILLWAIIFSTFNFYWLPNLQEKQKKLYIEQQVSQLNILFDSIEEPIKNNDISAIYNIIDNALTLTPNWKTIILRDENSQILYPFEPENKIYPSDYLTINHNHDHDAHTKNSITLVADPGNFTKEQNQLSQELRWAFLILFLLALLFSILILEKVVRRPITKLLSATNQLKNQDFNSPLENNSNDEIGRLIIEFDIMRKTLKDHQNKLKEARDKALESSEFKSKFISNVSHELKTPLNAIMGYAQLIEDTALNNAPAELEYTQSIHQSSLQLLSLIDNTLELSESETTENVLYISEFASHEFISSIAEKERRSITKNNNSINLALSDAEYVINNDMQKISKILSELMHNANKFTKNGEITISDKLTSSDGQDMVSICISDNGIGIDPEMFEKIFEPFFQVDNSLTRQFEGVGLGLAICQKLAGEINGHLHLESSREYGSKFSLTFPQCVTNSEYSSFNRCII